MQKIVDGFMLVAGTDYINGYWKQIAAEVSFSDESLILWNLLYV